MGEAEFRSYYGRPVLKRPVWQRRDIGGYLFTGGLAAGSSLLAAGGDLTGRAALRRAGRLTSGAALAASAVALVHDLGRPSRFHHMLRVAKPTSPMSVGTWILTAYGLPAGLAAVAEVAAGPLPAPVRRLLGSAARPAGLAAAALAPALATYTAVLLADTAVPTWNGAYPQLPVVFAGSAAAAAAGVAAVLVPPVQAGPARRLGVLGAVVDLGAAAWMEHSGGLAAETLRTGSAGRLLGSARALTAGGAVLLAAGRRRRWAGVLGGAALAAGSLCTRLGIFDAGVASTEDPRYTVVPQRERLGAGVPSRQPAPAGGQPAPAGGQPAPAGGQPVLGGGDSS